MSDQAATGADRPGFLDRARLRRRLRHLQQVKEMELRDLGGLTFELHRAGKSNDDLVAAKLTALATTNDELRNLQSALRQEADVLDLREAGLVTCSGCSELIASDAKYCSNCGLATQTS